MPNLEVYVDIEVDEFVDSCSKREIKELIDYLVEEGHLSDEVIDKNNPKMGSLEMGFIENINKLKSKYYSLSSEDEGEIMKIFKKYL